MMDQDSFTEQAAETLAVAHDGAARRGGGSFEPLDLAYALLSRGDELTRAVLAPRFKEVSLHVEEAIGRLPRQTPPPEEHPAPSGALAKVLKKANAMRARGGDEFIAVEHLLGAVVGDDKVERCLKEGGLEDGAKGVVEKIGKLKKGHVMGKDENSGSKKDGALEKYCVDLVEKARTGKLDPVIGRDDELRRVIRVLARRKKNNPVLVGPPGVGKTAIAEGLALRITDGTVPNTLKDVKLLALDLGALIAGAKYRGEFEERIKGVIEEASKEDENVVLFIDELHMLVGMGKTDGAMDAGNLLKPALARGELRVIGATTLEEYRQHIEKDGALERRLQVVHCREPSVQETISILRGLKDRYQVHHGIRITDGALVAAAKLSERYISGRHLPDKAIDLIDESAATLRTQLDSSPDVIDRLESRLLQLEVEEAAVKKDRTATKRLREIRGERSKISEQLAPLKARFAVERERVKTIAELNEKLDRYRTRLADAQRERKFDVAADLQYGAIPDTVARIEELNKEIEAERDRIEEGDSNAEERLVSDVMDADHVAAVVAQWTGIPVTKLARSEGEKLLNLGAALSERVFGQREAVDAIAAACLRSRAGLSRVKGPIAAFLFCGSSGVGKTELARALANELFDNEEHVVRIDCSELMEKHSVSKLIGPPPGYVGFEANPGQLTEPFRRRPYNVLLLDEVEKAAPEVMNILLQLLDDGRLTDSSGRTVNFNNAIVIMTSNLGSHALYNRSVTSDEAKEQVLHAVQAHFRPELLNRLDDVIVFNPLGKDVLHSIVRSQLSLIAYRLRDRDIDLDIDEDAVEAIIEAAYDPSYGARPIRRYLEKQVVSKLSRDIIAGVVTPHSSVTISGEELSLRVKRKMKVDNDEVMADSTNGYGNDA